MSLFDKLRAKIEAALKAASPAPWETFQTRGGHFGVKDARGRMVVFAQAGLDGYGNGSTQADAEFIVVARNTMNTLLQESERLRAENTRLLEALQALYDFAGPPLAKDEELWREAVELTEKVLSEKRGV